MPPSNGAPANGGPADDTVLLYGHLDKQPEMTGWRDGLGPWTPVLDGDRLYGRGGADDGYATFAAVTAAQPAQEAGFPHARLVVLVESSEESGSRDLPAHVEALADRIGTPSLVVCLTADPPYGSTVSYRADKKSTGWNAPAVADWLATSLQRASKAAFGAPATRN